MLNVVDGNVLDTPDTYIAHQCNCVTEKVSGVAKAIFDKYPIANDNENKSCGAFGSVKMHQVENLPQRPKFVLNMFTQYDTGTQQIEQDQDRLVVFGQALIRMVGSLADHATKHGYPLTISLPYMIGCFRAGGNWDHYSLLLEMFAMLIEAKGGRVTLFKYDEKAKK